MSFNELYQYETDINGNIQYTSPLYQLLNFSDVSDIGSIYKSFTAENGKLQAVLNEKYSQLPPPPQQVGGMPNPMSMSKEQFQNIMSSRMGLPQRLGLVGVSPHPNYKGPIPYHARPMPFDDRMYAPDYMGQKPRQMPTLKKFSFK